MPQLPAPSPEDAKKGWQIDPGYLDKIARDVALEWARPDWETVQFVLISHANRIAGT